MRQRGFEAFAVGGCVRDVLLGKKPADWDVATNAKPEEIQELFPQNFYANKFGTVTVLRPFGATEEQADIFEIDEVEVTTYRTDAGYSDMRHPDEVKFTPSLKEDLARRDFTINAMAMVAEGDGRKNPLAPLAKGVDGVVIDNLLIIDPFGGMKDLDARVIRAVGDPEERFSEDALRLLRAVRFAAQLDFEIEPATFTAIKKMARNIRAVSQERIRDELVKMIMCENPEYGFNLLQKTGLLLEILPEMDEGVGVEQNLHHKYTVFEHLIKSLQYAARYDYPLHVRLAALFHDIGKPRTRRKKGNEFTFYGHDIVSERITQKVLKRLRFSNELNEKVTNLVRHHMFYYDIGKVTDAGARRLLRRVGKENFDDLIKVRIAERKGSGVPKAEPYRLRHLQFLVEKAAQEPVTVGELAIGGNDLMKDLGMKPGPKIGGVLNALLAEVLDNPVLNNREHLLSRAQELKDKDPDELKKMGEEAKEKEEKRREDDIKRKYHV